MKTSRYHSVLRVSLSVALVALLFDGGFVVPVTKQLSNNTVSYLASARTSIFASVPENELNTITAELEAERRALALREASVTEREIAARDFGNDESDYSTYILSSILFILTVLIVMNYAMDWSRVRKFAYEEPAH